MRTFALMMVMMLGCSFDHHDAEPDAALTSDASECAPTLPTCFSLGCAVGALEPDCPRAEDTSVCYCESTIAAPGWCRRD